MIRISREVETALDGRVPQCGVAAITAKMQVTCSISLHDTLAHLTGHQARGLVEAAGAEPMAFRLGEGRVKVDSAVPQARPTDVASGLSGRRVPESGPRPALSR